MPVEAPHHVIKAAFDIKEGLDERTQYLRETLHELIRLIGVDHPNGALELSFITKFDYSQYLKQWEAYFDELHKQHIKKGWYNPFLSRNLYNFVRLLPVQVISQFIATELLSHLSLNKGTLTYSDSVELILNTDWLKCPIVMYEHQIEQIEEALEQQKACGIDSSKLRRLLVFARSYESFHRDLNRATESAVNEYFNTCKRYQDLEKEHLSQAIQQQSLLNLQYSILTFYALFTIPYALRGYTERTIQPTIIPESKLVKADDFIGRPLSDEESLVYILMTSTDPIDLVLTMKAFLKTPTEWQQAFVLSQGFHVLSQRFTYYTKLKVEDALKPIRVEPHPELIESIRVDQAGLRQTLKNLEKEYGIVGYNHEGKPIDKDGHVLPDTLSLPKHRWIRTLDGEFFVDINSVKVSEESTDKQTGETTTKERIEHVYNFVKTAVGNETETSLTETVSIYGKSITEDERRYTDPSKTDKDGHITIPRETLNVINDRVNNQRTEIGSSHLGHQTKDNQREAIQLEAKRWANFVIAQWKREVDGNRTGAYDDESKKKTTPQTTPQDPSQQEG